MKKLTALLKGPKTTVELQDSILTTGNEYVFVKKASIFWEYQNVNKSETIATYGTRQVVAPAGYYTIKDLSDLFTKNPAIGGQDPGSVLLSEHGPTGRALVANNTKDPMSIKPILSRLLGFDTGTNNGDRVIQPADIALGEKKSDVNLGLRYINVSCSLVDTGCNYTNGRKTSVIVSLPITTSQSLFGSVSNYIDTESKIPVMKGAFNEIRFGVTDQDGNPVDVGHILVELYIV